MRSLYIILVLFMIPILFLLHSANASYALDWRITITADNQLEPVTFGINPSALDDYDSMDSYSSVPNMDRVIMVLDDLYAVEINNHRSTWKLSVGVPKGQISRLEWDFSNATGILLKVGDKMVGSQYTQTLSEGSYTFQIDWPEGTEEEQAAGTQPSETSPPATTAAPATTPSPQKPRIVILANSIDYDLASDFFGFLKNKGKEIIRVTADNFDQYKSEKFIIILGGPDAYEGVGEIVREILSEDEENAIRAKGNRKKYVKIDPWGLKQGQRVIVIAGSDRDQTRQAHIENRDGISKDLEEN